MDEIETTFREAVDRHRSGDLDAAQAAYRWVLETCPDLVIARDNLCLAMLAAGDFAGGFSLYDVRFERDVGRVERPVLSFPEWRGEDLSGRSLLIWPEQGFGDQIMFARFAQAAARLGATVTMVLPPPLVRLLGQLPVRTISATGSVNIPRHDFWIMAGSLPGRLGLSDPGIDVPYLSGEPKAVGEIGVAWRGDPRHHDDANRSLPLPLAHQLLSLPCAISLHPEDTGATDFAYTADLIAGLRLVITVDTSVAHLAGAMGKPAWILLPTPADWRWGVQRPHTPWYPTAHLFRRPVGETWDNVVADVIRAARTA